MMRWMLRTPGLQHLVGRSTCLLTFTGRRSGKTYTTPISYVRDGDSVILTCHPSRQWWKNLATHPGVVVRLRGGDITGRARVAADEEAKQRLASFFTQQRMLARSMGLKRGEDGAYAPEDLVRAVDATVVIVVDLDPATA